MHNDLKHCNFRKDDAIAHLSDQLLTISTRLQELFTTLALVGKLTLCYDLVISS
jgi:hypothetical protein